MRSPDRSVIAVVGHGGFVGRAVCRELERRHVKTIKVGRDNPIETLEPTDLGLVDAVVWMANSTSPAVAETDPSLAEADHRALERCVSALRDRAPSTRLILTSSGGTVYADHRAPYTETTPTGDDSAYARAKLALENLALESGLETTVLRLSNPYGPGQGNSRGQGVVGHWLHAISESRSIVLIGPPETTRDLIFVDDVAAAIAAASLHPTTPPRIMNVGSGKPTSLGTLVTLVEDVVQPRDVSIEEVPARPFDRREVWLDTTLVRQTLGWQPHTDLRTGLEATWKSISTTLRSDRV